VSSVLRSWSGRAVYQVGARVFRRTCFGSTSPPRGLDLPRAHVDLSSNRCVINGDQVLLQQVLVNLIMNAIDAMAETSPARRHVTISSDVRANDVDVFVRDTGPGLPADIIGTLFRPFVTTKSHGLGIGLAIVQSIVDGMAAPSPPATIPKGARLRSRCAAANRRRLLRTRYPR
jgi:signal transduction histidine kinase